MELDGRERVTLEVEHSIPIGFQITLTQGVYSGRRGRYWLGAQHLVELTAEEVKSLGGEPPASTEMLLYDVSGFVRSGKIRVF
jgi:hypothetical protein